MDLNDDDLNNHECMAVVCQLVNDLERISMLNPSAEPDEWVQHIIDVLKNKSRNKNVRLFLAKVSNKIYKICTL